MIGLVFASAIYAAMFQSAAADGARTALRTCIKQAAETAKQQKMAADALPGFAHQQCANQETTFKSAVWAFDSKNKVARKQSEADVNVQIDDFMSVAKDRYTIETTPQ